MSVSDHRPLSQALRHQMEEAVALHHGGRLDDAAQRYTALLEPANRNFDVLFRLGVLRAQQTRLAEAQDLLRSALELNPASAVARRSLGITLNLCGRFGEALSEIEQALILDPFDPLAHNSAGVAMRGLGRDDAAALAFERAVSLNSNCVEALTNLAVVHHAMARYDAALARLDTAIECDDRFPPAHLNKGLVLRALGKHTEARLSFERALSCDPHYAVAYANIGSLDLVEGRPEQARRCFERALAIEPRNCRVLLKLADCGKVRHGDPCLEMLESAAADISSLDDDQRVPLHFALGKAYADLGLKEKSFDHYLEGNTRRRRQIQYDVESDISCFDRIREFFSSDFLRNRAIPGHDSRRPIFILGMMRSGSTLVEQILASHPQVWAAGERSDFSEAYQSVVSTRGGASAFPGSLLDWESAEFAELGKRYMERLDATIVPGSTSARITDKMPGNFSLVGLIHLALPNARLIHTRRDPVDTCLSCFSQLFSEPHPYTYDLRELGRFYRGYSRLMDHWRTALPQGVMLEVRYEDLVNDLEGQARRILGFCELPWNDACMEFHKINRPVFTASHAQVRQPLYTSSIKRWRPTPDQIKPLMDGLQGVDVSDGPPSDPS